MSLKLGRYAPVHKAEINRDSIVHDIIQGFAAPLRGPAPCRVELVAEEQVTAVADACGFSETAQAADIRFGWCGFRLGGLSAARALGGRVYLRCAVSGGLIEEFDSTSSTPLNPASAGKLELSVLELRKFIGDIFGCSRLDNIMPFAQRYRNKHGDRAFVEASYIYFHNRKPGYIEANEFLMALQENWGIVDCWRVITDSSEYASRHHPMLPGIFSADFPFGLELLD